MNYPTEEEEFELLYGDEMELLNEFGVEGNVNKNYLLKYFQ